MCAGENPDELHRNYLDYITIEAGRCFWRSSTIWIIQVYSIKTKLLAVPTSPFKIVHQGPCSVAFHIDLVKVDGYHGKWKH